MRRPKLRKRTVLLAVLTGMGIACLIVLWQVKTTVNVPAPTPTPINTITPTPTLTPVLTPTPTPVPFEGDVYPPLIYVPVTLEGFEPGERLEYSTMPGFADPTLQGAREKNSRADLFGRVLFHLFTRPETVPAGAITVTVTGVTSGHSASYIFYFNADAPVLSSSGGRPVAQVWPSVGKTCTGEEGTACTWFRAVGRGFFADPAALDMEQVSVILVPPQGSPFIFRPRYVDASGTLLFEFYTEPGDPPGEWKVIFQGNKGNRAEATFSLR